jgi:hypothetical protein
VDHLEAPPLLCARLNGVLRRWLEVSVELLQPVPDKLSPCRSVVVCDNRADISQNLE